MAREFTRNMFIMLAAIMAGAVVITYFAGDIVNRSQIDIINTQHVIQISDLNSRNENFTNHMLQGSIKLDAARETREIANYHFDFALFWFNLALNTGNLTMTPKILTNCTEAASQYLDAAENFNDSVPYFLTAQGMTNASKYLEILGYYIGFAHAGRNISLLRYNASELLRKAAENLSAGNEGNVTSLLENLTAVENLISEEQQQYEGYRQQIDGYLFFSEIREIP